MTVVHGRIDDMEHHAEYILGQHAIETILNGADAELYYVVLQAVFYMFVCGYTEEANVLLVQFGYTEFWDVENAQPEVIDAIETVWQAAGTRPESAWEPLDLKQIETRQRYYSAGEPIPVQGLSSIDDLEGHPLYRSCCAKAALKNYPPKRSRTQVLWPSTADELEILSGLQKFIRTYSRGVLMTEYANAHVLAAELAAKHGHTDEAIDLARRWAKHYPEMRTYAPIDALLRNVHLVPLLLRGSLGELLGVPDAATCGSYAAGLRAALAKRDSEGRRTMYSALTWRELLEKLSSAALKKERVEYATTPDQRRFSAVVDQTEWLGYAPATEESIKAAEHRLGLELPTDYRAFLLTSNGFRRVMYIEAPLLPVEQIGHYKDMLEPEIYDIMMGYPDDVTDGLKRAVKISGQGESTVEILLIAPTEAGDPWRCWFFAHFVPGEIEYANFRRYIEHLLEYLE